MSANPNQTKNNKLVLKLAAIVVGMFGFGFALVPLYDVLCDALVPPTPAPPPAPAPALPPAVPPPTSSPICCSWALCFSIWASACDRWSKAT